MKHEVRIKNNILVPVVFLILLIVVFSIASGGTFFSVNNLSNIVDQSMVIIIGGLGTIFATAIGGVELSNSGSMALSTLAAGVLAMKLGTEIPSLFLIIAITTGIGFLVGLVVTKCHVSSFLTTIAVMMILRGLFTFIQKNVGQYSAGTLIRGLYKTQIEVPVLIILIFISFYVLEYTKFGKYCKAIGENENMAINMGIPVNKVRILAFTASGLATGVASIFMMAKMGGVTNEMGNNYHMDVMMALFLGGILVTGGISTNTFKLVLGAVILVVLKNGLIMVGLTQTVWSQSIRGVAMMVMLFIIMRSGEKYITLNGQKKTDGKVTQK